MAYRNKTYIIFDGDEDMWAYAYMLGWISKDHIAFDFHNAHDLAPLSATAGEETVKRRLRERLSNTKQAIVLIGEKTKNLYRFVRWELEMCQAMNIPIVAVNLNGSRSQDDRCPPIIRDKYVVHVPFKAKIIQYALDNFPEEFSKRTNDSGPRIYESSVYDKLGLN